MSAETMCVRQMVPDSCSSYLLLGSVHRQPEAAAPQGRLFLSYVLFTVDVRPPMGFDLRKNQAVSPPAEQNRTGPNQFAS